MREIASLAAVAAIAGLGLAACGTTTEERAATGALAGAAVGVAVANDNVAGAIVGGLAGAAVGVATSPENRREYYDRNTGRYYYYDRSSGRYYWEDGEPWD